MLEKEFKQSAGLYQDLRASSSFQEIGMEMQSFRTFNRGLKNKR